MPRRQDIYRSNYSGSSTTVGTGYSSSNRNVVPGMSIAKMVAISVGVPLVIGVVASIIGGKKR